MPTLTIEDIPEGLYLRLKQYAALHHRTLGREALHCIEQALGGDPIEPEAFLVVARRLREKTAQHPITDEAFTAAKAAGRR